MGYDCALSPSKLIEYATLLCSVDSGQCPTLRINLLEVRTNIFSFGSHAVKVAVMRWLL